MWFVGNAREVPDAINFDANLDCSVLLLLIVGCVIDWRFVESFLRSTAGFAVQRK